MEAVIKQCEQTKMASDATGDKWFRIYMDREVDLQLGRTDDPWHCATCQLPAFRDTYFEDTRVSDTSAITDTETDDEMWNFSNTRKLLHYEYSQPTTETGRNKKQVSREKPPIYYSIHWKLAG